MSRVSFDDRRLLDLLFYLLDLERELCILFEFILDSARRYTVLGESVGVGYCGTTGIKERERPSVKVDPPITLLSSYLSLSYSSSESIDVA